MELARQAFHWYTRAVSIGAQACQCPTRSTRSIRSTRCDTLTHTKTHYYVIKTLLEKNGSPQIVFTAQERRIHTHRCAPKFHYPLAEGAHPVYNSSLENAQVAPSLPPRSPNSPQAAPSPPSPPISSGFSVLFCRLYFAATSGVWLIRSGAAGFFQKKLFLHSQL